ncbi:hypothetical protein G9A89_003113 [Geosiphon pyriformis]|nr:hypothetical protein G9A89_003113 [Geosiphon pyriformis]
MSCSYKAAFFTVPPYLQPICEVVTVWIFTTLFSIPACFAVIFVDAPMNLWKYYTSQVPKTIVITDSSSGIGGALANTYADLNTNLGLIGRDKDRLEKVAQACRRKGAIVEIMKIEFSNCEQLAQELERFDEKYKIDLLFTNAAQAGVSNNEFGLRDWTNQWEYFTSSNITGNIETVMAVFKRMQRRKHGQIAIMLPVVGLTFIPQMCYYNASKAALLSLARDIRYIGRTDNIRVNVISPGIAKGQSMPVATWLVGDMNTLAQRIKNQLYADVFLIGWPFSEDLVFFGLSVLPPRVAEIVHWAIAKAWGKYQNRVIDHLVEVKKGRIPE